jgi:hypothetical protein
VVKQIGNVWRFREYNGAGANGWRFVRNLLATDKALAIALIAAIEGK